MRKPHAIAALLILVMSQANFVRAGEGCADAVSCAAWGNPCANGCPDRCGCGLLGRLRGCRDAGLEGLDPHFNCGYKGSYNYPVPSQYTYHWPGMYKQNLMTDYVSPWRFPPLKPYVDETPIHSAEAMPLPALRAISASLTISAAQPQAGEIESISSRLTRAGK